MVITYIQYLLWLFYLVRIQNTLKTAGLFDAPIRKVFWEFSVIVLFFRLLDIALGININYSNDYLIYYLNFFIRIVHPFLQGMILARLYIVVIFNYHLNKKENLLFTILFTIFLTCYVLFTNIHRILIIPHI